MKKENQKKFFIASPQVDKESGEVYLLLSGFSNLIDISVVHSYSIEQSPMDRLLDEKLLVLKFYDKDGNQIKPF